MSFFTFLNPQDVPMDAGGLSAPPTPPQNEPKGKVKKNYADIESAYGEALKVLRSAPSAIDLDIGEQDFNDIKAATDRASNRDNPVKLADDLRVIAGRGSLAPEYAQKLFGVADKLTRAYKAKGELEEMRQPGQPLAITKPEIAGRQAWLGSEIQKKEEALKTAGSIRTPQLQEEMKKLREEEGRVALATQNAEFGPPEPPPLDDELKVKGMDRKTFLDTTATALQKIGMLGNMRIHPGAFGGALVSVYSAFGKAGDAAMNGLIKASQPKEGGFVQSPRTENGGVENPSQPQVDGDPDSRRIQQRQDDVMNAVRELKNLQTFDSTWKVVLFALFSMIIGPGPAAVLFTNKAKRGQLKMELDAFEADLERQIKMRDQHLRMQETARHHAITEGQAQERLDQDAYMDEEYLKLRRETARGKDPVADQLLGSYRMWKDEVDEAEGVLNSTFTFNDAEMKSARQKRARALPQLEGVRNMILKYRQQKLAEMQGQPAGAVKP